MFEGAAALFIAPELAASGRLPGAALAVLGRFMLLAPGFDARLGRPAAALFAPFGRFAAAALLPALGRFAGFALAIDAPGFWLGLFGRAP